MSCQVVWPAGMENALWSSIWEGKEDMWEEGGAMSWVKWKSDQLVDAGVVVRSASQGAVFSDFNEKRLSMFPDVSVCIGGEGAV